MELKLSFPADSLPLAVIAAAKIAGVPISTDPTLTPGSTPIIHLDNGLKLQGTFVLLRYISRVANIPDLYEGDAFESSQIDEWLEYAPIFASGSQFEEACGYVDGYLLQHTFLVGHSLSIADIAVWSGLAGS